MKETIREFCSGISGVDLLLYYLKNDFKNIVTLRRILYEYKDIILSEIGRYRVYLQEIRCIVHTKDLISELKVLIDEGIITKEMYTGGRLEYRGPYSYDDKHSNSCTRYLCKVFNLVPIYVGYVRRDVTYGDEIDDVYITLDRIPVGVYSKGVALGYSFEKRVDELLVPLSDMSRKNLVLYMCRQLDDSTLLKVGTTDSILHEIEGEDSIFDEVEDGDDVHIIDMEELKRRRRLQTILI